MAQRGKSVLLSGVAAISPGRPVQRPRPPLPRWPFAAMFVLFPAWWLLGFGDMMWIPLAGVMAFYLIRRGAVRAPRGFFLWLLFLLLMVLSVVGIDTSGRLIGFVYRALMYAAVTVVFIYVYNGRQTLSTRYVLGVLTVFWVVVIAGGYLGIFFPEFSFRTPLGYVLPASLQQNELVSEMVIRRATQYNPDSFLQFDPRPAAPFLYTNGWGNSYSLLLPAVVAYAGYIRGTAKFWWLMVLIPVSLVPAVLTLNRGMFLGIGIAVLYAALRLAVMGRLRALLSLIGIGLIGVAAAVSLDLEQRLGSRLEQSSTTEDRANLYSEAITRTLTSPLFGFGAPRPSFTEGAPSVGTQGHVWTVLFSHGFPAVFVFLAALAYFFFATWRVSSTTGLALNTIQLVILVEVFYYGVLPHGLMLAFVAGALALRGDPPSELVPLPLRKQMRVGAIR